MCEYKCKNCGGIVKFECIAGEFICENCGTKVSIYDIESINSCFFECATVSDSELETYISARTLVERAETTEDYLNCIKVLESLTRVFNSEELLKRCKWELKTRKDAELLETAEKYSKSNDPYLLGCAIDIYKKNPHLEGSEQRIKQCQSKKKAIEAKSEAVKRRNDRRAAREANFESVRKIAKTLLSIVLVAAIIFSVYYISAQKHNVKNIKIEIVNVEKIFEDDSSSSFDACYYIYFDFKIDNQTPTTLESLEILTNIKDSEGRLVEQITSSFGSYTTGLSLEGKNSVIIENYLSQRSLKDNSAFAELYETDFEEFDISFTITRAHFGDGHTYRK